jgi:hypothetical protein
MLQLVLVIDCKLTHSMLIHSYLVVKNAIVRSASHILIGSHADVSGETNTFNTLRTVKKANSSHEEATKPEIRIKD